MCIRIKKRLKKRDKKFKKLIKKILDINLYLLLVKKLKRKSLNHKN